MDRCGLIRDKIHKPALTTDVIVGFPGETDAEFAETCRVVRQVGFSKVHVFPFSARRGTAAAEMPDQIPKSVKAERSRCLTRIEKTLRRDYFDCLVGEELAVLVESLNDDKLAPAMGTSCRYAPVKLPAGTLGRLVNARIIAAEDEAIVAST